MDYNGQLILCDNDRDKKLRVLVACEESQTVTIEFRKIGVKPTLVISFLVPEVNQNGTYSKM